MNIPYKIPKFSIIIPVYNVAPYIKRCINSIRQQSFSDFEILLINDGSTDGSKDICEQLAKSDQRIRVFHQSNQGVAVARNKGLNEACGEWVWFIDSDDYIVDGALQLLNNIQLTNICDTIFFKILHEWNGIIESVSNNKRIDLFTAPKNDFLEKVFSYANPSILFKNSILQENVIRFSPGICMGEDLELQYKYLLFAKKLIYCNSPLYVYCHRHNSAMTNSNCHKNNYRDSFIVARNLHLFLKENSCPSFVWFNRRIRIMIKSGLHSASKIKDVNISMLKMSLHDLIKSYRNIGCVDLVDASIRIALISPKLYFLVLRIYSLIKS